MSNRILVAIGIAFVLALLVLIYAVAGNERTASNSSSPSATTGQSKNRPRSRTRKQRRPRRLSRGKTAPRWNIYRPMSRRYFFSGVPQKIDATFRLPSGLASPPAAD
jgi:hypothetical protein